MEEQVQGLKQLIEAKKTLVNSKFISIASGKGGVGKTNFAVNFAYTLANEFGKKVLLIDADIGMGNIHILLGSNPNKNMKNLLNGEDLYDIITHVKGFDVLFGFSGIDSLMDLEDLAIYRVLNKLDRISSEYDYIIIDNGAGISTKVISFLRASNKAYIITTPEPTALMDAYALIKSLNRIYGYSKFKIVINMCRNKTEEIEVFEKLNNSTKKFLNLNLSLAGGLSFSKNLKKAVENKSLIVEEFPTDSYSLDMKRIASLEVGEPVKEENPNFWKKVFSFLKQR